jgi:polyribonucleotide nucleotidyltransferase
MNNPQTITVDVAGKPLTLETGRLAKQANAAVLVSYGDTRVLVTAVSSRKAKEGIDFMPLTIEFQERFYAAGKIPGSFLKREGRPTTEATLAARLIDRPNRPLFPEGYYFDTQVVATVLSADLDADIEVAASIGAGAVLHISDIPFNGPTAACRVGKLDGKIMLNPTWTEQRSESCEMDILVSGTSKAIMMVEGAAKELPEAEVLEGILLAHKEIQKICAAIEEFRKKVGVEKRAFTPISADATLEAQIAKLAKEGLTKSLHTKDKQGRREIADATWKLTVESLVTADDKAANEKAAATKEKEVKRLFELLQYNLMREMILTDKVRIDGRDTKTVRKIVAETGILPRAHGSALFTRGETQVLAVATLGTADDEQIVDTIYENSMKKFMLHYNFPPYSTGETGRFTGQSRREIGHGALAERSVTQTYPSFDEFPYTMRLVCETLESNGSSSMASVCASSMAMMDAGVPYPRPVAGIAMGLIKEGSRVAVLSDILGDEDFLGDMDFKVAGTCDGITGIQMDIKIEGVDASILKTALEQAREGRIHILGEMAKAIDNPRGDLNQNAPRITTVKVPVDKIGAVIGPSGKVIKDIVAKTGAKVNIDDDGTCSIASNDSEAAKMAMDMVLAIITEAEEGKIYKGVVKRIADFGAFVGILPNTDGLLHISEIAHERIRSVTDVLKEGDEIEVKVIEVDNGRVRLSRKALLPPPPSSPKPEGFKGQGGGNTSAGAAKSAPASGGPRPVVARPQVSRAPVQNSAAANDDRRPAFPTDDGEA